MSTTTTTVECFALAKPVTDLRLYAPTQDPSQEFHTLLVYVSGKVAGQLLLQAEEVPDMVLCFADKNFVAAYYGAGGIAAEEKYYWEFENWPEDTVLISEFGNIWRAKELREVAGVQK